MKILGLVFIGIGILLCLTFIFIMPGLVAVGVGALLYMAGKTNPRATLEITPGAPRRLFIAALVGIALIGLIVFAGHNKPAPAQAATPTASAPPPASSRPPEHHAKPKPVLRTQ